ncbi:MgtC/SapB family protein [Noviherbaspirillum aridicola]|uniref:Protein MgtC n=1 Tax=Noviherbaspirillum aridicola TaxID=2849687 RepID=A0ABQ4QAT2_9BURK|nr:MgtC/SapB family protein [Noviherbaspirillum aridicola]GIZ54111.1 Mg(2+) transporter [Noviherbaspirillum aridicola]
MEGLPEAIAAALRSELPNLSEASAGVRSALRLIMAVLLGAVIGLEREKRGTAAGFRTHMLVALGAALFVVVPAQMGMESDELSRVLQGLISGIGFLGAGAIIKLSEGREVRGLTTAASVWLSASIGVATGLGQHLIAIFATVLGVAILMLSHPKPKPGARE